MLVPRWKNLSILRNSFSLSTQGAQFHSTPASQAKWKGKWNNDGGGANLPSKTYVRYVTRQKRADTKNALKDILFYGSSCRHSSNIFQDADFMRSFNRTGSRGARQKHKQPQPKKSSRGSRHQSSLGGHKCRHVKDGFVTDCDADPEIFYEATVGGRYFTWSFRSSEDYPLESPTYGFQWRNNASSWAKNRKYWDTSGESDKDTDTDEDEDQTPATVGSFCHRTILGLPAGGPLKIEDVKKAFHASAKKWHPDKHHGTSQAMAAEKFKLCVDAYESLRKALSATQALY